MTIDTLKFARLLHDQGIITGLDDLFEAAVVVTETTFRRECVIRLRELQPGDGPIAMPTNGEEYGEEWKLIHEVIGPAAADGSIAQDGATTSRD